MQVALCVPKLLAKYVHISRWLIAKIGRMITRHRDHYLGRQKFYQSDVINTQTFLNSIDLVEYTKHKMDGIIINSGFYVLECKLYWFVSVFEFGS